MYGVETWPIANIIQAGMVIISRLFLFFDPLLPIVAYFSYNNRKPNVPWCFWRYKMATVSSVSLLTTLSEDLKEQFPVKVYF